MNKALYVQLHETANTYSHYPTQFIINPRPDLLRIYIKRTPFLHSLLLYLQYPQFAILFPSPQLDATIHGNASATIPGYSKENAVSHILWAVYALYLCVAVSWC